MRLHLLSFLLAVALFAACNSSDTSDEPAPKPKPPPAITRAELNDHLEALQRIADHSDGNRSAGTPGYDASADYVAERAEAAGLEVSRFEFDYELSEPGCDADCRDALTELAFERE